MEQAFRVGWVHVVPSLCAETFGLTAAEAMMRGTAVVGSRAGGLAEIIAPDETGLLVPPGDVEALRDALVRVLCDRELAERMGRRGLARARDAMSEAGWVDRFVGFYRQLVRDRGRRRGGTRMTAGLRPSISVVLETCNEESEPETRLDAVLAALDRQTHPRERLEIIAAVGADNPALQERLRADHPGVRIVEVEAPTYYAMKIAGIEVATGDIVALLDSDTVPTAVWAERIADRIEAGADAVAGKTRYPEGRPFARTFDFFNFGYVQSDEDGRANAFLPNNAAFRREVIEQHSFDPRIARGGAGHLLSQRLRALGYRLDYEPEMRVTHNLYGFGEELLMRIKVGYDAVNLSRLDTDAVMEESAYLQRSPLALLVVAARRVVFDAQMAIRNREDLGIPWLQVPYFLLISPLVRALELGASVVALVKPGYFERKFGW